MSGRLLRRSGLRYLAHHRLQLLLSVMGVALGVAVVLSIDLAIQSARTGFTISAEAVAGRATHVVVGDLGSIDEALFPRIRTHFGGGAAPVVEGYASTPTLPGRALRVLGIDPFSEGPFRPYVAGGPASLDAAKLVTTRLGVVLSRPLAERAGLVVGDTLPLLAQGESWALPVVEVIDPSDALTREGLSDVALMDIAGAQEVLRMTGRLSRIDLRVEGDDGAGAVEALRATLPAGVAIEAAGTRSATMSGMIDAFDVNLTALSLLALIFGMFLIYNAVTFSVVQRREILGRLRALGVTRGEVVRTILGEACWIGTTGAVLGIAIGIPLARGLVGMVARTINDLYFAVSVERLDVAPQLLAKAFLLGVGATVLAALPPALEAGGERPRSATLRSEVESRARRLVPLAGAVGVALCAAGAALLWVPTRDIVASFTSLFLVMTGLALMTPLGTLLFVSMLGPPLRRLSGSVGVMAARGVASGMSRTGPAIAALVVAVSVTVGLGVMIRSFRGTLSDWLDGTLRADVYVSLPGPNASRASGTLWPDVIEALTAAPDVVGASTYRGADVVRNGDAFHLVALDLDQRGEGAFDFLEGDADRIMSAFRDGRGVLVSEPYAYRRRVGAGDEVVLTTGDGDRGFPILGVFYDYGSDQGTVMMPRSAYDRSFDDPGITSLGLFLREGADSKAVVDDLLALVPDGRSVIVRTNRALRAASLEVFDRTFRVTAVLRLLAFLVAFVGVVSALAALELERTRELGLLRAIGLTPGQLGQLVVTQTGVLGLAAGILSVPMGLVLSFVMIDVVNKRSFGWTLHMQVGSDIVLQAVGLAFVASLLAGLYPAWRMARTSPAVALRGE